MCKRIVKSLLLVCCICTCCILSSCGKVKSYKDIKSVVYASILTQKEDRYMVFLYGDTCSACEELQELICKYVAVASSDSTKPKLYVLNTSNTRVNKGIVAEGGDDSYTSFIGTTNYEDIKIATTPALIFVEDGKVSSYISTKLTQTPKSDIRKYIESLL